MPCSTKPRHLAIFGVLMNHEDNVFLAQGAHQFTEEQAEVLRKIADASSSKFLSKLLERLKPWASHALTAAIASALSGTGAAWLVGSPAAEPEIAVVAPAAKESAKPKSMPSQEKQHQPIVRPFGDKK